MVKAEKNTWLEIPMLEDMSAPYYGNSHCCGHDQNNITNVSCFRIRLLKGQ